MFTKGFTLIETMVALFVLVAILIAAWQLQSNVFFLNSVLFAGLNTQDQTRRVLRQFGEEVRPASPSSLGAYPITTASGNTFVFYSDIDSDNLKERVRYFVDNNELKKGVITPTGNPLVYDSGNEEVRTLVRNMAASTDPVFQYFDTNYDGTSSALTEPVDVLDVRLVQVTITTDIDPNRPPAPQTFTTQVSLRNLKDNL